LSVTVRDLLKLELLAPAKVIAGADGLDRVAVRVNFTDTPLQEEVDVDLLGKGDVFICSFYAMQDDEDVLYQNIAFYIRMGSACCIALDEFVPHLPQRVLELANAAHYPILHINGLTPYAELIRDITRLILLDQDKEMIENQIGRLLSGEAAAGEVNQLYQNSLGSGAVKYAVVHVTLNGLNALRYKMLKEDLSTQFGVRFLQYFNGGFFLLAGDNAGLLLERTAPLLCHYDPEHSAGCSEVCSGADQLPDAFRQALSADETGRSLGMRSICYENLSVYKLLIPLRNSQVLEQFCTETLTPLRSANLLETTRVYFECDGNIEKTAEILRQHKNTIRFRINKAKVLLGMEYSRCAFLEKVSLALKGEALLRGQEGLM
jgi:hypothetical protein